MAEFRTPDELVARWIEPEDHVHLASTMSRPNALIRVLARTLAGRASLTVSANAIHAMGHCLTMAGVVGRARTAFVGNTIPSPRPNAMYNRLPWGDPYPVEETSLLSLNLQLLAGACGLTEIAVPALVGSDLDPDPEVGPAPRTLPALRPDVTLVHAHCADRAGNLYLCGPSGEGIWGSLAARRGVLATVEIIVDQAPRGGWSIPAQRVLGIAVCPMGAHPQGLPAFPEVGLAGYLDDSEFLVDLADACGTEETRQAWYHRWVERPQDQEAYLVALGEERARELLLNEDGTGEAGDGQVTAKGFSYSLRELTVVVAAREIVELVRSRGYRSILTGIGTAQLACWLAAEQLRAEGVEITLLTELGMVDYRPAEGDGFLFSQHHVERSRVWAGTLEVLGGLVSGGKGVLAVLSAAEIDPQGRLNASRRATGEFLVGSGGANDIVTSTDTLVVARGGRERLVAEVGFVTCPGERVTGLVTELGRFRRSPEGDLRLASWCGAQVPTREAAASEALRRTTAWPTRPGPDLEQEAQPSRAELEALRALQAGTRSRTSEPRSGS